MGSLLMDSLRMILI
ncbi:hypothetical protein RDI58_030324 [Solanum bulbocastanum]|uniref:Uncharacterized protein n=2 Tax=Solanum TaxID=4107 RepID=A0AAN8SRC4_SOLBU